ncbi:hypothetical protein KCU71_g17084, partial [Aureobasidium melanogenum]
MKKKRRFREASNHKKTSASNTTYHSSYRTHHTSFHAACHVPQTTFFQTSKTNAKRTAAGIPTWSPTVVLICRSTAYVWQSGRDAQFSADCG